MAFGDFVHVFRVLLRSSTTGPLHRCCYGSDSYRDAICLLADTQTSGEPSCTHFYLLRSWIFGNLISNLPCFSWSGAGSLPTHHPGVLREPDHSEFHGRLVLLNANFKQFYRNAFDIYGSSHQIMHIVVVFRALLYQTGLLTARQHWQNERVDELGCTRA